VDGAKRNPGNGSDNRKTEPYAKREGDTGMTSTSDILYLGRLEPPLLVFGGPYGNLQASLAVKREAEDRGLAARQVLCTGDIVAYCGAPAETVAMLRDWGVAIVKGNVEEQIGANADDCGCGFAEGSPCDVLSRSWYAHSTAALDPEIAGWMGALPSAIRFEVDGHVCVAIHGGAERNNQFVFESTPAGEKHRQMAVLEADIVIAGHSGIPFTQRIGSGIWHNAGVVGMPANDATADVWYSTIERGLDGRLAICHHRLCYDHRAAASDMRRRGFPDAYATALESGLWPSLDVLPEAERAATGRAIAPSGAMIDPGPLQSPATKKCQVPSGPMPSL
jgi:predicted phosphodiesterase